MKFSFSANAFRRFTFLDAVRHIAEAGYTGIEIMCDTPHAFPTDLSGPDIRAIQEGVKREGLSIANLNGFMMCKIRDFHHPSWIEADKEFRELRIQYTLDCIDLAAKLGAGTVSTEPGGPLNGYSIETAREIFMEGLARVLPRAVEKGVVILIEPEPGLLIQTAADFVSFMDQFGQPGLGLNFDVGHFYCVGEDPVAKIAELKAYIHHFHLEDIPETREHRHILLGEGGIDIPAVLKAIEGTGYRGFVTVELYPYLESAPEIACKARRYLREACGYA